MKLKVVSLGSISYHLDVQEKLKDTPLHNLQEEHLILTGP